MKVTRIVLILFILLLHHVNLIAGAWVRNKGSGYSQLSFTYLHYHEVINGGSLLGGFAVSDLKRWVNDHTLQGYLEYGMTDRITFIGVLPVKLLKTGDELLNAPTDLYPNDTINAGKLNTFGNMVMGAKYLLINKQFVVSAEINAGLPVAGYDHVTGLRSGYDGWQFNPMLSLGRGFEKTYFSSSVGFQLNTNHYADDFVMKNEFGYRWQRKSGYNTWFIMVFGAFVPVTNGNYDDRNSIHTGLYQNKEGFIDPGIKINHALSKHLSVNISSIGAVWAVHGGNSLTYTGGISWEW